MCKSCMGCGLVSIIATWGFFALLLNLLNVANPGINAIWLTLLICIAACCCPIMNPKIAEKCTCMTKSKKKK